MKKKQNESLEIKFDQLGSYFVYRDFGPRLFGTGRDGQNRSIADKHAQNLHTIECLIEAILANNTVPFTRNVLLEIKSSLICAPWIDRYVKSLPQCIETIKLLPRQYEFNAHINAFAECCQAFNLTVQDYDWNRNIFRPDRTLPHLNGIMVWELVNELVACLRFRCSSSDVFTKNDRQRKESIVRVSEYSDYVDSLFDVYKKLIVLRIYFTYEKEFSDQISIEEAFSDWKKLTGNMRGNSKFDHLVGSIVRGEIGACVHAILFFDGSFRLGASHETHAQEIGQYWVEKIASKPAVYFSCNGHVGGGGRLGRSGTGPISRNDEKSRQDLQRVVEFLCEQDRYIKPKTLPAPHKTKLIRRGNGPN